MKKRCPSLPVVKKNDSKPYLWDTSSVFTSKLVQMTLKLAVLLVLTLTSKF